MIEYDTRERVKNKEGGEYKPQPFMIFSKKVNHVLCCKRWRKNKTNNWVMEYLDVGIVHG